MNDIILKIDNISYEVENKNFSSSKTSKQIIKNISFEVARNKIIGITGESGSGKTTLVKILSGILEPSSGKINNYFQKDWSKSLPKPIQILFQNDGELINPYRKVEDVLAEAFELKHNHKKDYSKDVVDIIDKFQLPENIKEHKGFQLSGGEQQRVALARIFIVEPEVLILDEPFSSQDIEAQLNIVNLIKQLQKELKLTVICVSHDLNILRKISDQVIVMFSGEIVERNSTEEIFKNPQNDYTKFLLSAQSLKLSKQEIEEFLKNYEQN